MFSGGVVNSLRLITDLHEMIQLVEKLLTGTVYLNIITTQYPRVRIFKYFTVQIDNTDTSITIVN